MNTEYEQDKDLFDYTKWIASNYYKFYQVLFQKANLGIKDVQQESYIATLLLLRKIRKRRLKVKDKIIDIKDKDSVRKIMAQAVVFNLHNLFRKHIPTVAREVKLVEVGKKTYILDDNDKVAETLWGKLFKNTFVIGDKTFKKYPVNVISDSEEELNNYVGETKNYPTLFKFGDIKKYCSKKDYKLLTLLYLEKVPVDPNNLNKGDRNLTLKEIAKILGVSKQAIFGQRRLVLGKLRDLIKNDKKQEVI
jgi:hypothetical protein